MSSGSKPRVNLRSTAVKRIMQEAAELADPDEDDFVAGPLESDIFEWHCTLRGVPGSEFEAGLYHLRILLPPTYPMSAPDIMLMTPNGRFELGKKICIDGLTSFHAGSWQPAWGVRTAILGLRSFWTQTGADALAAIGALDYSKEERRRLARLSHDWQCPTCGVKNRDLLKPETKKKVPDTEIGKKASVSKTEDDFDGSASATTDAGPNAPDHHNDSLPARVAAHVSAAARDAPDAETRQPQPFSTEPSADQTRSKTIVPPDTGVFESRAAEAGPDDPLPNDKAGASRSDDIPSEVAVPPSDSSNVLRERRPQSLPSIPVQVSVAATGPDTSAAHHLVSSDPPSRRTPILWIDIGIFVLSSLLCLFIARRMARSGPLDELEQA